MRVIIYKRKGRYTALKLQSYGRKRIYTDIEPTKENIPYIINETIKLHNINASDMKSLVDYFLGKQDILDRVKEVRSDINNKIVVNYAYTAVRDIVGYFMGTPVQYVLRSTEKQQDIEDFNTAMIYENRENVDMEVANMASICGVGYKYTNRDKYNTNEIPFELACLSPITTYCVYGTEGVKEQCVMQVTFFDYFKGEDNIQYRRYVVYTEDTVYEYVTKQPTFVQDGDLKLAVPNVYNIMPIVEYPNNQWRMGDFETAITILDAINNLASNSLDDVEQVVQSILLLFGIPKDQHEAVGELSNGDMLIFSGEQGITQDGKYLSATLNSESVKDLREYLEEAYRVIVGIPERKTRGGGGGDTGDAVKLRDGWADIELVARGKETYWKQSERKSIGIALDIMHNGNLVKNLNTIDVDIKFSRNKNDNLQSKVQSGATLYSMGVAKADIANAMDITTDTTEFVRRWEKAEEDKQKKAQEMITKQNQNNNPPTE